MFKKTETGHTVTDPTKINHDTSMEGEIFSKNDIRLDGILNGKMTTEKKIIIGKKGVFSGKLKCENLILEGSIDGEATVSNSASLMATSSFNGVLSTHKFRVEEGAFFEGDCKTMTENKPAEPDKVSEVTDEAKNPEPQQDFQNTSDQKKTIETEVDPVAEKTPGH